MNTAASRAAGSFLDRSAARRVRRGGIATGVLVAIAGSTCPMGALACAGFASLAVAPASARAQCGDEVLTQSIAPDVIEAGRAVWCGTLEMNHDTQIARGFVAPHDMTISCVTFGVTRNTGGEWPCHVRIATGAPTDLYVERTVLAEETVQIPAGTFEEFFTVELPAVFVPEGTAFTIELESPSRFAGSGGDGALLSLGFNGLGQSAPSYLRAPACGAELRFVDLAALGFPNSHAAISLGTESGYAVPTLGGFQISPIGDVVLSTSGDQVTAFGDGSGSPIGLSIEYGDLTMGAGATLRMIGDEDGLDPTIEIAYYGETMTDRLVLRHNPAAVEEATLDVVSDNPDFDRFRVHVFRDGLHVGTLEDLSSGDLRLVDPDEGRIRDWIKEHVDIDFSCAGMFPDGLTYTLTIGISLVAAGGGGGGGGVGYIGDEIWIQPATTSVAAEPPLTVSVTATDLQGVALALDSSSPHVVVGDAPSNPRLIDDAVAAQVGVSFKAINTKGTHSGAMYGTDLTGDGVADLRYAPGLAGEGESVRMELGGVESASIGMDLTVADPLAACMIVCSFEVGPVSIPTGKTIFDPWPADPMLVAVEPDFTGVGDETYTFQAYDAFGTLVHEEAGLRGIAGGSSRWPSKVGKLGGPTPCFVMCYPDLTLFRMAGGHEFDVHEVRVLVEGAPPAGPLSALDFAVAGMDEVRLFDPVTVLPDFAEPCYADLDGDGSLTLFDFLAFQNLFATGSSMADCDEDGSLTLFDFLCFQNAFAAGCP